MNRYLAVTFRAIFLVSLTGCSGTDGIVALDRDATAKDKLPEYVSTQGLAVDSVRRVAEQDGVTYFIARQDEDPGFCVIRTKGQDEAAWGTACGTGVGRVITNTTIGIAESVTLVTDGYTTGNLEEEGWTKISDNLLAR